MTSTSPRPFIRPRFALPLGRDPFPSEGIEASQRTIYDVLVQSAGANPDHVYALQYDAGVRALGAERGGGGVLRVTLRELLRAVDRCSAWLVHAGLARRSVEQQQPPPRQGDGDEGSTSTRSTKRGDPLAIFLPSSLGIFIYVVALLKLGNPCALFSARLSAQAMRHLVDAVRVKRVLSTPALWRNTFAADPAFLDGEEGGQQQLYVAARPYTDFLAEEGAHPDLDALTPYPSKGDEPDHNDATVFAWHSSGSTGLPKPVFHTHRFWLCYLACHEFGEGEGVEKRRVLNMPPLYHGFGMLPMSLAIAVGFTVVLPPPSTIPTAQLTIDMLEASQAHILFTVPSLLTDMLVSSSSSSSGNVSSGAAASSTSPSGAQESNTDSDFTQRALRVLRALDFVTFAGAPIKPSTGDTLASQGVTLLNHFGATETGSLAPIRFPRRRRRRPSQDKEGGSAAAPPTEAEDWRWLLLRKDMGLEFAPFPGTDPSLGYVQLNSRPFGWRERFELADALIARPVSGRSRAVGDEGEEEEEERMEYTIAGRLDNVLVLATGEKVSPILLEQALVEHALVEDAILFGEGRFQVGALVELSIPALEGLAAREGLTLPSSSSHPTTTTDTGTEAWTKLRPHLLQALWPRLESANALADAHAQLEQDLVLFTTRTHKPFVRTAKGTTARRATLEEFQGEIARAYEEFEGRGGEEDAVGKDGDEKEGPSLLALLQGPTPALEEHLLALVRTSLGLASHSQTPSPNASNKLNARIVVEPDTDLFEEGGMDSLKAARLLRTLTARLSRSGEDKKGKMKKLPPDFVYRHPSVALLARGLRRHLGLRDGQLVDSGGAAAEGRSIIDTYGTGMDERSRRERSEAVRALVAQLEAEMEGWRKSHQAPSPPALQGRGEGTGAEEEKLDKDGATVLLTGSTGGLGVWLVYSLLQRADVKKVICLVRSSSSSSSSSAATPSKEGTATTTEAYERQLRAMRSKGVPSLPPALLARLSVLGTSDLSAPFLGLPQDVYETELLTGITHIIHNAWSVDFLRPLRAFEAQVRATARLLALADDVVGASQGRDGRSQPRPVRFLFSSSIAVVGKAYVVPFPDTNADASGESTAVTTSRAQQHQEEQEQKPAIVPEVELDDASRAVPMGYGLAKLACEHLVSRHTHTRSSSVQGTSIRIGQLTGAQGVGNWSTSEHMAAVVASSAHVGALPRLRGWASWMPTNRAAEVFVELALAGAASGRSVDGQEEGGGRRASAGTGTGAACLPPVLHLENPVRTSWDEILEVLADELGSLSTSTSTSSSASDPPSSVGPITLSPALSRRDSGVLLDNDVEAGEEARKRQRMDGPSFSSTKAGASSAAPAASVTASAAAGKVANPRVAVLTPPETLSLGEGDSGSVSGPKAWFGGAGKANGNGDSHTLTSAAQAHHRPSLAPNGGGGPTPPGRPVPIIDFAEWLRLIQSSAEEEDADADADAEGNDNDTHNHTGRIPARKLLDFLQGDFVPLATGAVRLSVERAAGLSPLLRSAGPSGGGGGGAAAVGRKEVREYVHFWRSAGLF